MALHQDALALPRPLEFAVTRRLAVGLRHLAQHVLQARAGVVVVVVAISAISTATVVVHLRDCVAVGACLRFGGVVVGV